MRFVISTLAVLSACFLGLFSLLSAVVMLIMVVKTVDLAVPLKNGLISALILTAMSLGSGWLAWRMVRHLRGPDPRTARDVSAVACLLLGVYLLGVIMRDSLSVAVGDVSAVYWETAGSIVAGFMIVLLYRYVAGTLAEQSYPPKPPGPGN